MSNGAGDAGEPSQRRRHSSHWAVLAEAETKLDTSLISVAIVVSVVLAVYVTLTTGWSIELAALLAILGLLSAQQVIARQRRVARELEQRIEAERAVSTTLEHTVRERSAKLADTQRVLERMWMLGHQITLELHPARVVDRFMEAVIDVANVDSVALAMVGDDGRMRLKAIKGVGEQLQERVLPQDAALHRVLRRGEPMLIEDVLSAGDEMNAGDRQMMGLAGLRATAMIPIARSGAPVGALALGSALPRNWSQDEIARVMALTDMLSVALSNAELVETLRQAEWRFRTLFRAAPDAVFTVLQSGRVREVNDAVRDVVGLDPVQVMGRQFSELVIDEDRQELEAAIAGAIAGKPARIEVRVLRNGRANGQPGETQTRLVALAASRLPETEPATVLVIGRDVSGEREMRARLMETERLAAVGELVAGVAHEVNNPLSSISAYAQLLLRDMSLSAVHRDSIEVIRAETSRASQVVKDLLAFARRSTPERRPVDLNQVIERSLRLRAYQLSTLNIEVQRSMPQDLPAVIGDARQLQQVVLNLVTNAIQAMSQRGGGTLSVSTSGNGEEVQLEVADSGTGIPDSVRPHIFEPFFTTKREGEGTGLGLSVSYGIVSALGGRIELVRTGSEGTRFRVSLPAADAEAAVALVSTVESRRETPTEGMPLRRASGAFELNPRSALSGLRLLVVDDEASLRRGIEAFGRMRGFDVVTADEGRSALELVRATSFDAVVCDLRMPGMDGVAFHDALRTERPGLAARTVFITGDVMTNLGRSSPAAKQPMLAKPFTFERLEETLVAVVRSRGA